MVLFSVAWSHDGGISDSEHTHQLFVAHSEGVSSESTAGEQKNNILVALQWGTAERRQIESVAEREKPSKSTE